MQKARGYQKSVALQALTNLGPAEHLPLAVFPDCTRRYWVDMWISQVSVVHENCCKPILTIENNERERVM
jgi:hypothetical protein